MVKLEINNIYLGDSNELIKLLNDKSIDCIYTDVPYLYENGGTSCRVDASPVSLRINANATQLNEAGIDKGFDYDIFNEFARVMKKCNLFIWCSKLQLFDIANWWFDWANKKKVKLNYEILVWAKSNPIPSTNNKWLSDIEYCLYFRETGVRLNDGYQNKHKFYLSGLNVIDKNDYEHPTCKPLDFVEKHILHATKRGDVILDPFAGSGTTLLACKRNDRNYIGFEINPHWFNISQERLKGINIHGEMNLLDLDFEQLSLFDKEK